MRRLPNGLQEPAWDLQRSRQSSAPLLSVRISLITPMFGGGAEPRAADPDQPVRGAAVRGHLRFWWRACQGATYTSSERLFDDESRRWGSTEHPAAIEVVVSDAQASSATRCADYAPDRQGRWQHDWGRYRPVAYALFPFQGQGRRGQPVPEKWPDTMIERMSFTLTLRASTHALAAGRGGITLAQLRAEAEGAVWAWLTFGGMGARTRRGCGALYCGDAPFAPPSNPAQLVAWFKERAARYVAAGQRLLPIPVLAGAHFVHGGRVVGALDAWGEAVGTLQALRQGVGVGRNPGQQANRPGRSRWPEPDSVRQVLGLPYGQHTPTHPARPFFPRADLGLPIIFQQMVPPNEPAPQIEVGEEGAKRFASPLIVKAVAISPTQAVPLLLCLNTPHVWEGPQTGGQPNVELRGNGHRRPLTRDELGASAQKIGQTAQRLGPMQGQTSARGAALTFAAGRWHRNPQAVEVLP